MLNVKIRKQFIRKTPRNKIVRSFLTDLKSSNGMLRQKARKKIVSMGVKGIEYLVPLLEQPDKILRWEVVKALGEIAATDSVPLLIELLHDKDEDIRWLAAEGLISINKNVFRPLLEELIRNPKSAELRRGAHHVLYELSKQYDLKVFSDLLSVLNNYDAEVHTPIEAMRALNILRRINIK